MIDLPGAAYRGRFAPSPTGPLHLGSLLAAWASWMLARQAGGQWLIRIEDLDPPRERPGAAEQQLLTLQHFGLESDAPVVWQSQRGPLYQDALARLQATGDAFACHCSRRVLAGHKGVHQRCVAGRARRNPSVRFRVPDGRHVEFDDLIRGVVAHDASSEIGDFVLRRADGFWAYQLAVVVDDAAQGITDVVRGADLLDSTPRQILLQRALGLGTPCYAHLPVIVGDDGRKLSKSLASLPLDAADPLPALRLIWRLLGQPSAALDGSPSLAALLAAAVREFDIALIPSGHLALRTTPA
ncbi:MAG: glutamyl-Q tRNA(Asp) ligase [Xanthomonadaceae bacterium]|nr:glutamyl-Q tRNA(Asp) ligase [Xanthomonadaceae bacterium]